MKIWIFDIETSPHLSFHFGRWQQNIPRQNTVSESSVSCWAGKWFGDSTMFFMSEWEHGHEAMMQGIWDMLDEADVVIGFNSNKFDVKRVNAEFLRLGWEPPSPYMKLDLLTQARKQFAFSSNRLKDLLKELGLTPKLEDNANMQLWMDVYFEKKAAQERMKSYNKQDVRSTEEFYQFILPWITPHPNWGLFVDDVADGANPVCPTCGEQDMHPHKKRYTKVKAYMQWKCGSCGSYHRGRKALKGSKEDQGVLA